MHSMYKINFGKNYGNLLSILNQQVDYTTLITLAQFYDLPLRCFTFQDFQLAPTLEEFSKCHWWAQHEQSRFWRFWHESWWNRSAPSHVEHESKRIIQFDEELVKFGSKMLDEIWEDFEKMEGKFVRFLGMWSILKVGHRIGPKWLKLYSPLVG